MFFFNKDPIPHYYLLLISKLQVEELQGPQLVPGGQQLNACTTYSLLVGDRLSIISFKP